jgi:hypothetical protein
MLYKNEEPYKLAANEIKEVETYFHNKFPVKVTYPKDRIQQSKLPHNRLPDKPASISFPLRSVVRTDKGIETWRYAENVVIDNVGGKRYMPAKFMLEEKRLIDRSDIELIYFLLRKSEHRFLSEEDLKEKGAKQPNRPKFMFEDLVSEAEKRVEKKKLQQEVDALIFGDMAFSEEKLREVAGAYFIPGLNDLAFAQVRMQLHDKIWSTKDGPHKFFDMVNAEDELKARNSIQKAKNLGLLKFNDSSRNWFWEVIGGKSINICKIPPNVPNATEALYDYYKGSQDFQEDVKSALISKKVPVKEKVE